MTEELKLVEVTQADREAAAGNILRRLIYQHGGEQSWMDASTQSMRMGEQDDHWEVQAFARHRVAECLRHSPLASTPTIDREQVARKVFNVLRNFKLSNMAEADDPAYDYPLADLCSRPEMTVADGEEQIGEMAAEVAHAIIALLSGEG